MNWLRLDLKSAWSSEPMNQLFHSRLSHRDRLEAILTHQKGQCTNVYDIWNVYGYIERTVLDVFCIVSVLLRH